MSNSEGRKRKEQRDAITKAQAACRPPNDFGGRWADVYAGPVVEAVVIESCPVVTPSLKPYPDIYGGCPCLACWIERNPVPEGGIRWSSVMNLCPACGNKRCPAANDHAKWVCSGSNDTGQVGSLLAPGPVDAPCAACHGSAAACDVFQEACCETCRASGGCSHDASPAPVDAATLSEHGEGECVPVDVYGAAQDQILALAAELDRAYTDRNHVCAAHEQTARRHAAMVAGIEALADDIVKHEVSHDEPVEYEADGGWRGVLPVLRKVIVAARGGEGK
jgi:hypothetical protein